MYLDDHDAPSVSQQKQQQMAVDTATNVMPLLSTIGFGDIAAFLLGFAIRRIIKIFNVIAGVFFAA
jgi:uncharacterized membrane protein (Fun14 family)